MGDFNISSDMRYINGRTIGKEILHRFDNQQAQRNIAMKELMAANSMYSATTC